jgi:predicted RNase H-like nuclease (RuvC/YqgF family)
MTMTASYKKSAKDLAFDKERAKYSKQIRELESQIKEKDNEICFLKYNLDQHTAKIEQQEDWINRLLEYTEMSKEDMINLINKEKNTAKLLDNFDSISSIFKKCGVGLYY